METTIAIAMVIDGIIAVLCNLVLGLAASWHYNYGYANSTSLNITESDLRRMAKYDPAYDAGALGASFVCFVIMAGLYTRFEGRDFCNFARTTPTSVAVWSALGLMFLFLIVGVVTNVNDNIDFGRPLWAWATLVWGKCFFHVYTMMLLYRAADLHPSAPWYKYKIIPWLLVGAVALDGTARFVMNIFEVSATVEYAKISLGADTPPSDVLGFYFAFVVNNVLIVELMQLGLHFLSTISKPQAHVPEAAGKIAEVGNERVWSYVAFATVIFIALSDGIMYLTRVALLGHAEAEGIDIEDGRGFVIHTNETNTACNILRAQIGTNGVGIVLMSLSCFFVPDMTNRGPHAMRVVLSSIIILIVLVVIDFFPAYISYDSSMWFLQGLNDLFLYTTLLLFFSVDFRKRSPGFVAVPLGAMIVFAILVLVSNGVTEFSEISGTLSNSSSLPEKQAPFLAATVEGLLVFQLVSAALYQNTLAICRKKHKMNTKAEAEVALAPGDNGGGGAYGALEEGQARGDDDDGGASGGSGSVGDGSGDSDE